MDLNARVDVNFARVDNYSFAIFSNSGYLEFSTRLNFTILKPWDLIMLHMKFKIHGCSG